MLTQGKCPSNYFPSSTSIISSANAYASVKIKLRRFLCTAKILLEDLLLYITICVFIQYALQVDKQFIMNH